MVVICTVVVQITSRVELVFGPHKVKFRYFARLYVLMFKTAKLFVQALSFLVVLVGFDSCVVFLSLARCCQFVYAIVCCSFFHEFDQ